MRITLIVLLLLATANAEAAIVEWRATGYIDTELARMPGDRGARSGGPGFLDVRLTLDDTAPDLASGDTTRGLFANVVSVHMTIDGMPISIAANWPGSWAGDFIANADSRMTVYDNFLSQGQYVDGLSIVALDQQVVGPPGGGFDSENPRNGFYLEILLGTNTPGSFFTSDALPTAGLNLSQIIKPRFSVGGYFWPGDGYTFGAPLETFAPVPLPMGLYLLLSGGALLANLRRRTPHRETPIAVT